jgi:hypothetical protein
VIEPVLILQAEMLVANHISALELSKEGIEGEPQAVDLSEGETGNEGKYN